MKPRVLTNVPKAQSASRESWPEERRVEVSSEESTVVPKYIPESRESQLVDIKDEAPSSSSMVKIVPIVMTKSQVLLNIVLQSQEIAITMTTKPMTMYTPVGHILERYLRIGPSEASIWS